MVFDAKCSSKVRLDGKTAVITGCNTGIGKETVKDLYKRGARVVMACRSLERAEKAAEEIYTQCKEEENLGKIVMVQLDLTSLRSIRACAQKLMENENRIDILINNAGIMMCPESRTIDGFEMQFGTNHLGHFLFTLLLLPKIIKSKPARIVTVSSYGHTLWNGPLDFDDLNWKTRTYTPTKAYFQSKLANVLFSKELARRLEAANIERVNTYCLHPGFVDTELQRHIGNAYCKVTDWMFKGLTYPFAKTPEEGAQTTIHCAVDEKANNETGLYYAECKVTDSSSKSKNEEYAKKLWDISLKMVGLEEDYNPFIAE